MDNIDLPVKMPPAPVPSAPLAGVPVENIIQAAGQAEAPIALYEAWIAANPTSPMLWGAWFNLGVALAQIGNPVEAAHAYQTALALRPNLHAASVNLGLLFESAGQPEQALDIWQRALQPDEARIALQIQQGRLLETMNRLDEAEAVFSRILKIDPNQHDVVHHLLHLRQRTCQWPVIPPDPRSQALLLHSGPFCIMALTDDIELQREAAGTWIKRKTSPAPQGLAPRHPYGHKRIRIGYLSSDFCRHAMGYLITGLFEHHDRTRFEIYGYCASRDDGSALRQRILASFDHVLFVRDLTDEQVAERIRADEIDFLIDLNGITDGSRLASLRWRPAPLQATYLGFVGPIPLPELDYVLCDSVIIPPEHKGAYGATPLPVGPFYQANDDRRTIGQPLTRADEGLPEDKFVFCCFSKHYKITEQVFASWMEILHAVPHSVLWLAEDNAFSQANLIAAARAAGVAQERLIFSPRTDPDRYMNRLALADLFLDTFPYNSGTVASDALRMELPLLTLCGRAYASRMALSLLHALGAQRGITTSLEVYVQTAVTLATDEAAYRAYKSHFTAEAWHSSIGNTARFTAGFEAAIEKVVRAAETKPSVPPDAYADLGAAFINQGRWPDAVHALRAAITYTPDDVLARINLANALMNTGAFDDALAAARTARQMALQNGFVQATLGGLLGELGDWPAALELCRQAVAVQPDLPTAWFNLSHAAKALNLMGEAETAIRRAISLRSDDAEYHFHLAHILLVTGRLSEGWEEYEWRWRRSSFLYPTCAQPQWLGDDLSGKTILVGVEQGLGDIIQFARYLPLLVQRAARVLVLATPPTRKLLGSIEGIELVASFGEQAFDVHCPLLSLPLAFGTTLQTIPAQVPYLSAPRRPTLPGGGLKVGLVWAGNPATLRDRFRSPGLKAVAPLFEVPGVDIFILQMGPGRAGLADYELPAHVHDLGANITDLADTAAIMTGLDLVISSCTSPLHLAGALGVPAWGMIPFAPHFTWLLEHEDTLWYPTLRLFRQAAPGTNWSDVMARITAALVDRTGA
ncbi:MAG TPA: tetratricopeptide repeat protein [Acidocella sp.]|nr:tetratricopeptide repeat protein [Acidocella sp.]